MDAISFDDFLKVELRVGRVLSAEPFAQARKPAYVLHVDFGHDLDAGSLDAESAGLGRAGAGRWDFCRHLCLLLGLSRRRATSWVVLLILASGADKGKEPRRAGEAL